MGCSTVHPLLCADALTDVNQLYTIALWPRLAPAAAAAARNSICHSCTAANSSGPQLERPATALGRALGLAACRCKPARLSYAESVTDELS